jgi:NADH dehydrogenase
MNSRTVIIGAGFAGRRACRALSRSGTEVLLFDPNGFTTMLPSLPDLAGDWVPENIMTRPLREILPPSVRHIQEQVTSIDLIEKIITTDHNTFPFDHLLIASGSVSDFHGFDQHLESIYPLDSLHAALRIRKDFPQYLNHQNNPHVLVAGGGYTGLELASSLRFRSMALGKPCRITIADPSDKILPFLNDAEHHRISDFLKNADIEILHRSRVTAFDGRNVHIGKTIIQDAFFCWAGGSKLAIPHIKGSVSRLRDGRLLVNPDLSLPKYPDCFVAGDSAAFMQNDQPLRKAINFAWYAGHRAGNNIIARMQNNPTTPFKPVDLGWVIPLHAQSTGNMFSRLPIYGRPGLRLHYFMCGFRNFSIKNFMQFTKISLKLFPKENAS